MRADLDSVLFDDLSTADTASRIAQMARWTDKPRQVCVGTVAHLVSASVDQNLLAVLHRADLVVPGESPLVWLSQLTGWRSARLHHCVSPRGLIERIGQMSADTGLRIFLLGSADAAGACGEYLLGISSAVTVCGLASLSDNELRDVVASDRVRAAIASSEPDLLITGFGAPEEDLWIAHNRLALAVPVSLGLGTGFGIGPQSGVLRTAPSLFPLARRVLARRSSPSWQNAA